MLKLFLLVVAVGLAHCRTTESPQNSLINGETEWDCTDDHMAHGSDPRKFLQSPNGFGEGANVAESTCPTQLQEFTKVNGLCRCSYVASLRQLLEQDCNVLVPNNVGIDEYDLLIPNLNRATIDELYVRQTCLNVLPKYVQDAYRSAGIVPLFFNATGCRCDWVENVDRSPELNASPPPGARCDRLVDQNYTSQQVSSDEVGNWIDTFPYEFQRNLTVRNGGAVFGEGLLAMVTWRLMSYDFDDINLVASFETNDFTDSQLVFSNLCQDSAAGIGGTVDVRYSPSSRQFTVRFFGEETATCVSASPPGTQTVQLKYSNRSVSLLVNNVECDISRLNPVAQPEERLQFNSKCPMQVGGNVLTDISQASFGRDAGVANGLVGTFYRFMVLSHCENPPAFIQDRLVQRFP